MKIRNYRLDSKEGLKMVLLSDLHNRPYEHIIKTTASINPDIIAIAGDLICGFEQYDRVAGFLNACGNIAPTFVSLGNHDIGEIIGPMCFSVQCSYGVTLLDNSYVDTVVKGISLRIGGLSSPISKYWKEIMAGVEIKQDRNRSKPQKLEPNTVWLTDFTDTQSYKLLLCHQPEYYRRCLSDFDIDLILAGHAHGGQWRIGSQGVYAPGQGLFPAYSRGVYDGRLVVSAGLSNTTWIPRFFNPREIVVVEV